MRFLVKREKLILKRESKGLSKIALSKKAGMGGNAICRIEKGSTTLIHHLSALAIAKALGCKVEDLFTPIIKK